MNVTNLLKGLALAASLAIVACGGAKVEPKFSEPAATSPTQEHGNKEEKAAEVPIPTGLIKINDATAEEIASYKVSGLAVKTAEKLVAYREANGPFHNMEDIDKVPGVGEAMLGKLEGRLDFGAAAGASDLSAPANPTATTAAPPASTSAAKVGASTKSPAGSASPGAKININTCTVDQLVAFHLKGIGEATAQKIIDYRASHGKFKSIDELDNVSGIGAAKIDGFRDQVTL